MELDSKIARVKELIAKREELDTELNELLGGTARERRVPKCSTCNEPGHRASTCPSKPAGAPTNSKPASAGFLLCAMSASHRRPGLSLLRNLHSPVLSGLYSTASRHRSEHLPRLPG